jgi:hypothetical protein
VVSFSPVSFTPRGRSHRYQLESRLGGPKNLSARYKEEENLLLLPGIEPPPSIHIPTQLCPYAIVGHIHFEIILGFSIRIMALWNYQHVYLRFGGAFCFYFNRGDGGKSLLLKVDTHLTDYIHWNSKRLDNCVHRCENNGSQP